MSPTATPWTMPATAIGLRTNTYGPAITRRRARSGRWQGRCSAERRHRRGRPEPERARQDEHGDPRNAHGDWDGERDVPALSNQAMTRGKAARNSPQKMTSCAAVARKLLARARGRASRSPSGPSSIQCAGSDPRTMITAAAADPTAAAIIVTAPQPADPVAVALQTTIAAVTSTVQTPRATPPSGYRTRREPTRRRTEVGRGSRPVGEEGLRA